MLLAYKEYPLPDLSAQSQAKVAYLILQGFEKNYRWFTRITGGAQKRFEQANWLATQKAMKERIAIYEQSEADVVAEIYQLINPLQQDRDFWRGLKEHFLQLLDHHPQFELAKKRLDKILKDYHSDEVDYFPLRK